MSLIDETIPRRRRAPAPYPRTSPLGRLGVLMAIRRNPLSIWTERHFTETVLAGNGLRGHGTFLADPPGIRRVLVDNAANYPKDELQRKVLAPGLGQGLLVAEGDLWRRTRRILAPVFTPRRVAAQVAAMAEVAETAAARIARRPGRVIDVAEEMTRVTYDILTVTLFSNGLAGDAASFSNALTRYFNTQGVIDPLDVLDAPAFLPRIGSLRSRPALRFFEERVRAIVTARRRLIEAGEEPPDDLLTALLAARDAETGEALSETEVGANVVTFIGAGHETTANALTWAVYLLSTAPDVRAQVEAEADGAGSGKPFGLADFPMTRAVIEEALRLYPPVALLSRQAVEDDVVSGHDIPAGSLVAISPWVLHRHRVLWGAPDEFRPERFLPGARETIDRFAYLPFGVGPRVCIGMGFALQEAVTVLLALARHLRLDHAGDEVPEPLQRITLRPKNGMRMSVSSRRG